MAAAVVAAVPDADQLRFRAAEVSPELDAPDPVALAVDAPEEVVGREEREVAAEVAVTLRQVVDGRRDVLLVTGEDDQVVEARQVVAAREPFQVLVGQIVDLLARVREEAEEAALLGAVVR